MAFLKKVKSEVAVVLGVAAGVGEVILTTFPSGSLHDLVAVALPLVAALGIRARVLPVDKVIGSVPALIPLAVRLEGLVADLLTHKAKPLAVPAPKPVAAVVPAVPPTPPVPPAA